MIAPAKTENSGLQASYNASYVWLISLVARMGGLLFGYDWIVISGTDIFYEAHFHLTSSLQIGWAKSSALLGCLIGALIAGALSDRFGRKVAVGLLRAAVRGVVRGHGVGGLLCGVYPLAHCGRRGHRPGLQPVAHVYRRGRARPGARAGWFL